MEFSGRLSDAEYAVFEAQAIDVSFLASVSQCGQHHPRSQRLGKPRFLQTPDP